MLAVFFLHDWFWEPLRGLGYQFWSGIGSDLGEITLITAAAGLYWKHSCHVSKCWRPGRHDVDGTPYTVCRRHHPEISGPVTAQDVAAHRKEAAGE